MASDEDDACSQIKNEMANNYYVLLAFELYANKGDNDLQWLFLEAVLHPIERII